MTPRRRLTASVSGLALASGMALGPLAPAAATVASEPPVDLADEVTDAVDAFGDRADEVRDAVDRLAADTRYQLFVVFVDSFDGLDAVDWANTTATDSGLGVDDVLLAVAVQDRRYALSVDDAIPLTDDQLDTVEAAVEDALHDDDWAGAAIAAADGYRDAAGGGDGTVGSSSGDGGGFPWLPVLLVVAAVVGVVLLLRRRQPAGIVRGPDGLPLTGPAALPTEELATVASRGLVAVDDALKASESELGFAQAQFGMQATTPFAQVMDTGKQKLAQAFQIRRQLDDATPEAEPERRRLLLEIVRLCDEVDHDLDAQTAEFARLRDLQARAPQVLAELDVRAVEVEGRLPASRATLTQLAATYPAPALASVTGSIDRAATLLTGARENVAAGLAAVDTDRAKAVALARVAEDAVAQAAGLLDGVDRAGTDLAEAGVRIDAALASLGSDVADADRLAPADAGAGAAVAPAVATAREAIAAARAERATGDPLALLRRLVEAEASLDAALRPARDHEEQVARATAQAAASLGRATSLITAATGYIDSHRADVGADARTRLAEAARLAGEAEQARATDPLAALPKAQEAEQLAMSAQQLAEGDVERARPLPTGGGYSGGFGGGSSSGFGGALNGMFGGTSGGGGGGWGGSGGSWGGGSSSRSRSTGRTRSSSGSVRRSSSSSRSGGRGRRGGGGRF